MVPELKAKVGETVEYALPLLGEAGKARVIGTARKAGSKVYVLANGHWCYGQEITRVEHKGKRHG